MIDVGSRMDRIEELVSEIEASGDAPTRARAQELAAVLLELHRAGLARIFERLASTGAEGRARAEACARDEVVQALLAIHELDPAPRPDLLQIRVPGTAPAIAPEVTFEVTGASAVPHAATPILALELRIKSAPPGQLVRGIALRCQVRIEPQRRRYSAKEAEALGDLFGDPARWGETLKPLLWTHASVMVPPFPGETSCSLHLPCTYDLAVASARYFDALEGEVAPLLLLFSGSVFHAPEGGALQVEQIPWSREARFDLPIQVWRETMNLYYPGGAGLLLRSDVHERLRAYRSRGGFTTWEQALESLLAEPRR